MSAQNWFSKHATRSVDYTVLFCMIMQYVSSRMLNIQVSRYRWMQKRMSTLYKVNLFRILEILQCTLALYIQFLPILETSLNPTGGWACSFVECSPL